MVVLFSPALPGASFSFLLIFRLCFFLILPAPRAIIRTPPSVSSKFPLKQPPASDSFDRWAFSKWCPVALVSMFLCGFPLFPLMGLMPFFLGCCRPCQVRLCEYWNLAFVFSFLSHCRSFFPLSVGYLGVWPEIPRCLLFRFLVSNRSFSQRCRRLRIKRCFFSFLGKLTQGFTLLFPRRLAPCESFPDPPGNRPALMSFPGFFDG